MRLASRDPLTQTPGAGFAGPARPVLLATLDVPFDDDAAAFAVESAAEARVALHVANVVPTAFMPVTLVGWDYVVQPELEQSLQRACRRAASLGVEVERVRVRSPHPVAALLEVTAERSIGLLVFGPDRTRLSRWRYGRAARTIRRRANCLVWLAA